MSAKKQLRIMVAALLLNNAWEREKTLRIAAESAEGKAKQLQKLEARAKAEPVPV